MATEEFEISMIIHHPENKYKEEEIVDIFITWVESIGLFAGGRIRELKESEKD